MKIFRPGLKPIYVDEPEPAPVVKAGPTQSELIKMAKAAADARHALSAGLRQDGPTLEEYVAAGYDPKGYPPAGFAPNPPEAEGDKTNTLFGVHPTELIPAVKPKPLIDNSAAPGDPTPPAPDGAGTASEPPPPGEPQVDELLK